MKQTPTMASAGAKIIRSLLPALLVFFISVPIIAILMFVETGPSVPDSQELTKTEISQVQQLLLESAPESPFSLSLQELELNGEEVNLMLRYASEVLNLSSTWAPRVSLSEDSLMTEVSIKLVTIGVPLYLNIRSEFSSADNLLQLDNIRVGKLQIPQPLLRYALNRLQQNLDSNNTAYQDFNDLLEQVEHLAIASDSLELSLQWNPQLISRIRNNAQQLLIPEQDRQRIIDYYLEIGQIATTIPVDTRAISLNRLLVPLFRTAHEKSLAGSDPVAENRTLLQALAVYVANEGIDQLLGDELGQQVPAAKFIEVRLQRRQDLARHLTSIASISASAGADLAEMLSTTKEAYDARYRSGFSFSDLAANTVGVTLASFATADRSTALLLQERMSNLQSEADYMPEIGNNRDGLSESEFNAIYNDRNSQVYEDKLSEIQQLINNSSLFKGLQ